MYLRVHQGVAVILEFLHVHLIMVSALEIWIAALASAIHLMVFTVYQAQPQQLNQQPHQSPVQLFHQLQPPLNHNAMKENTDVLIRI